MIVSMIAAMSENRVIGRDGGLPWRLPDDLKRFKQITSGHPIIMGRHTWETMDGPLPSRTNIVITRDEQYQARGAVVVHSLEAALDRARRLIADNDRTNEVFIIGGGEIYSQALPLADRLYLTIVHTDVHGDTYFPKVDFDRWTQTENVLHPEDDRHAFAFTYATYERQPAAKHAS